VTIKLEAREICLSYFQPRSQTRLVALDRVSLSIREGEFVSVVGPSGCGKTTFLNIVDGLLRPTSGEIIVDGTRVSEPGPDRAVVFQDASLLPWRTVLGNVTYGLECQNRPMREAQDRARHFIDMVGLSGFEQHYPHELSGGMQQRVNLARALVMDPQLLLMDEPFAALDAQTREAMQEELIEITLKAKKTVLFITHQIDEAVYLSDRVIVFSSRPGRVKADIAINIERPRKLRLKRDPRFHGLEDEVWSLVHDQPAEVTPA
jgi:NitT/TauT family transport system ATP-binding protein